MAGYVLVWNRFGGTVLAGIIFVRIVFTEIFLRNRFGGIVLSVNHSNSNAREDALELNIKTVHFTWDARTLYVMQRVTITYNGIGQKS